MNKKKVIIIYDDIIYSLQSSGGISVYWNQLEESIPVTKRYVYKNREKNIFYKKRDFEKQHLCNLVVERYKNTFIKIKDSFIFHSSYYRYCKNKNAINITTVHDFTYELFRKDIKSELHKNQKKNAVMHSNGVICISENTKNDLLKYYPNYKGKIQVIYHGYDKKIFNFLGNTCDKRSKNVIFLGSRASYKGFDFTVKLISRIPQFKLIIIGGGGLNSYEKEQLEKFIPYQYEKIGFVTNEELAKLYNESFALFYPSEYEGFGFPVIEAQACGCPVICQKKSSIPEISGDKCVYVDSSDFESSLESIKELFNNYYYDEIQKKALENVKRFSWDKCIKETLLFYKTCLYESFVEEKR